MTISSISVPTNSTTSAAQGQSTHHSRRAHGKGSSGESASSGSAGSTSTANESLEQLAEQGDPMAIAELNAQKPQAPDAASQQNAAQHAGASEPGKGEQIDQYV